MASAVIAKYVIRAALDNYLLRNDQDFILRLYTNNLTPTRDSVLADFTQAAYPGYAATSWVPRPTVADGNEYRIQNGAAVFAAPTSGGAVNVYGIYVEFTNPENNTHQLLAAARFAAAPIVLTVGGASLSVVFQLFDLDLNNP